MNTSLRSSNVMSKLKGSVKEPNMFHNYETEKVTHKASDAAENLSLCRVVRFFCPSLSCMTHLMNRWYGMVWYGILEFNVPLDTV